MNAEEMKKQWLQNPSDCLLAAALADLAEERGDEVEAELWRGFSTRRFILRLDDREDTPDEEAWDLFTLEKGLCKTPTHNGPEYLRRLAASGLNSTEDVVQQYARFLGSILAEDYYRTFAKSPEACVELVRNYLSSAKGVAA